MSKVRVRFAPSPTGALHIGGVRTALYNYLFAKKHGGDFLLRIEDTDQTRYVEGAEKYILDALAWCGISPNEGQGFGGEFGPYKQSERKEIYKKYALELVEKKQAYYAFDTPGELDSTRKNHEQSGETFTYGPLNRETLNNSLSLSPEEVQEKLTAGIPYVIRFKIPKDKTLHLQDIIRGNINIESNTLDDKILFKSDGMPTYHLANVVDDYLMQITHVIRGEEWLPSMALHVLLYQAFGFQPPLFAHLPLLLKPEGKGKLSKRDADKHGFPIFPLNWEDKTEGTLAQGFREAGYFPEALLNFLALLSWSDPSGEEIFSLDELAQRFELENVSKSGARFNVEKIHWYNGQYLQKKSSQEILPIFENLLREKNITSNPSKDLKVIESLKERASFVSDILEEGMYFYQSPKTFDTKAAQKVLGEKTPEIVQFYLELFASLQESQFTFEILSEKIKQGITDNQLPMGPSMQTLRLGLVGKMAGPDVALILEILGKEESISRLIFAKQYNLEG
ncbi:MAG: glutamate--tRNA ligase [Flavobacteriaceae bacterium]|nr:MAG: glutamate--tRNA ligase [Flavobacteriaceae bacterium]